MTDPAPAAPVEGARPTPLRPAIWALHMALPLLGLWLLIAQPDLDVIWEDQVAHFWLVAAVAGINVVLGLRMSEAARRRGDARLFLVALAFLSSAGFFALHALATPTVLLGAANVGFQVASPVGLLVFAAFAAASSIELSPERSAAVMGRQALLRWGVVGLLVGWGVVSLLGFPPLDLVLDAEQSRGPAGALAATGIPLYVLAAVRYFGRYRRRPAVMLISLITAFVLLAEALLAMPFARAWQVTWWEWHILMLTAFAFVAYSAHVQYRREGATTGLFNSISLEETVRRIREEHQEALEAVVEAMQRHAESGTEGEVAPVAARLGERFGLTEGQVAVLERAAEALATERQQIRRLGALVAVGREASVIVEELELLRRAVALTAEAFRRDRLRVGLVEEGTLRFAPDLAAGADGGGADETAAAEAIRVLRPVEGGERDGETILALPLTVKGHPAGVLEVRRGGARFAERDRSVLESLASQLSIALENARLYRQIDALFRQYLSPDVATTLLADPSQAALGGALAEVSVLFGDLRGFTSFSERAGPEEVVALLNRYFGIAVPLVLGEGGTVDKFVGDAIMVLWGAPTRQPDHALRAARAALAIQRAIDAIPGRELDWPRFRIGVNTGPALVGNIGSAELRNFTAIGDTVNLASRLEGKADPGTVVIGEATFRAIRDRALVRPLGEVEVKGKKAPVSCYVLEDLRDGS